MEVDQDFQKVLVQRKIQHILKVHFLNLVHHIKPQVAVVVVMVVLHNQRVMDNQVDLVVVQQGVVLHTLQELVVEILVVQQIQTLLQMVLVMMVELTQVEVLHLMEHLVAVVPVL